MHLNILRKDLKRKKTMNIILLISIILASMFASSSMNNLLSITTAMDSYVRKSELADYTVYLNDTKENTSQIESYLKEMNISAASGQQS